MARINEVLKTELALVPVSLASATASTAIYLPCGDCSEVCFAVAHAALGDGKKVNLKVYVADDSSGTNAVKLSDDDVTYTTGAAGVITASVAIDGNRSGYYGVVAQHDNGSAVIVAGIAIKKLRYSPAAGNNIKV